MKILSFESGLRGLFLTVFSRFKPLKNQSLNHGGRYSLRILSSIVSFHSETLVLKRKLFTSQAYLQFRILCTELSITSQVSFASCFSLSYFSFIFEKQLSDYYLSFYSVVKCCRPLKKSNRDNLEKKYIYL